MHVHFLFVPLRAPLLCALRVKLLSSTFTHKKRPRKYGALNNAINAGIIPVSVVLFLKSRYL